MATFIIERNQSLDGSRIKVPKNVLQILQKNNNLLSGILSDKGENSYKKNKGYKRNRKLLQKGYNIKNNKKPYNKDDKDTYISYNELEAWKKDFDNLKNSPKSPAYLLNGGNKVESYVNNTLKSKRASVRGKNAELKKKNIDNSQSKVVKEPMKPVNAELPNLQFEEIKRIIYINENQLYKLRNKGKL